MCAASPSTPSRADWGRLSRFEPGPGRGHWLIIGDGAVTVDHDGRIDVAAPTQYPTTSSRTSAMQGGGPLRCLGEPAVAVLKRATASA
ncbi:hypothetical protein A5662_17380 [Mycobacteriaceae bacterium 1482268.1]|nr:hypothetical protein A5662_17380 [Mycobacteriaceae bacterium 1482268.1]